MTIRATCVLNQDRLGSHGVSTPEEVRSYRAVHDSLRSTPHDRLDEQLPARLRTQGSTSKASTRLGAAPQCSSLRPRSFPAPRKNSA